jgi:hypothetical protein
MKKKNLEKALLFACFYRTKSGWAMIKGEGKILELFVKIYKKIRMLFRPSKKELEMLEKE